MRKYFLSLGVVLAALGIIPAAAQANHIDHAVSTAACVLVNGTPTIQGSTAYRDYATADKPVYREVYLDKDRKINGTITWAGPSYDEPWSIPTTPGAHVWFYAASWPGGNTDHVGPFTVNCPAPPIVTPTPTPTPTPVPPVPTPTPPPPAPPAPPAPPVPPHVVKAHCPTIHLILPTARHGVRSFGGRCSRGRVVDTTMYVTAIGQGRRIVCGTAKLYAKGPIIRGVWLYDQTIFCHHKAWGDYSLILVFHVRYKGHVYRCVKRARFFDHDPGGLPDTLVHAARSPWS